MDTILIVDDDIGIRQTLSFILQKEGYSVTTAGEAEEAMHCLQAGPYDLVILDLRMPGMSGLELLEEIRERYPDAPVFILTAHADLGSAIEAMRLGAQDYLTKPVDPKDLMGRIAKVLERKKRHQRRRQIEEQIAQLLHELRQLDGLNAEDPQTPPLGDPGRILTRGRFTIDTHTRRAVCNGEMLQLPPASFDYLTVLLRHSPEAVSYEQLVREVQGYELPRKEARDLARWHVYQLRRALEPQPQQPSYIITERGVGYRLVTEPGDLE